MTKDQLRTFIENNKDALHAEKCRRSFYYFIKQFWEVIISDDPIWNWHMEVLCNYMQKYGEAVRDSVIKETDLVVNVPPGTTKSTICTIMFPAWLWTIFPQARILTGSYSSDLAMDHSTKSRDIIQSPKYQRYFPYIRMRKDQNNKSKYRNLHNGERYSVGIFGAVTGFHAHIIIIDDPLTPNMADSDEMRNKANNFFSNTIPTRKINKKVTPLILIMQRLHEDDPAGNMISKGDVVENLKMPGTDEYEICPPSLKALYKDGLLDVNRLGRKELDNLKIDLGTIGFDNQIGQQPSNAKGIIFKKAWFNIIELESLPKEFYLSAVKFNADTAQKIKESNDPTGIIVYCVFNNVMYILDWISKKMEFTTIVSEIKSVWENNSNKGSIFYVEPKSSGSSVVSQLRISTKINIVEYKMPSGDKLQRANPCTAYCEAGRVVLIKGRWNKDFIDQVTGFPKAKNDEAIDNLSMAITQEFIRNGIAPSGRKWVAN